jgi:hypothetical protein
MVNTKIKLSLVALIVATAGLTIATTVHVLAPAYAQKTPQSGFGQASKAFATSEPGAVGDHSSSFAGESRLGIGNVAKSHDPPLTVGELGCALGTAQGFTVC